MAKSALHKIYKKGIREGYGSYLEEVSEEILSIVLDVADHPDKFDGYISELSKIEFMQGLIPFLARAADGEQETGKEEFWKELTEWRSSVFHREDLVGAFLEQWVQTKLLPDAARGDKNAGGLKQMSDTYSKNRQEEWENFAPCLDNHLKDHPYHTITDARRACANKFKCSLKTIERRTKGYKKPVK